jgi:hypothetical protein
LQAHYTQSPRDLRDHVENVVNSRSNKTGKYPVNGNEAENVDQPVIPARCESIEPGNLGMPDTQLRL